MQTGLQTKGPAPERSSSSKFSKKAKVNVAVEIGNTYAHGNMALRNFTWVLAFLALGSLGQPASGLCHVATEPAPSASSLRHVTPFVRPHDALSNVSSGSYMGRSIYGPCLSPCSSEVGRWRARWAVRFDCTRLTDNSEKQCQYKRDSNEGSAPSRLIRKNSRKTSRQRLENAGAKTGAARGET